MKQIISHPSQMGQTLQGARKHRKISQADMAQFLDASQPVVSRLEQNPDTIKLADLLKMCHRLGLELTISEKPESSDVIRDGQW
jgi:HTH-type transcriptional regulator/antitoxin HipB